MLELRVYSHIYNYYKNIAFMLYIFILPLQLYTLYSTQVIIKESNVYQLQRRTRRLVEIFCSNFKAQACHIPQKLKPSPRPSPKNFMSLQSVCSSQASKARVPAEDVKL